MVASDSTGNRSPFPRSASTYEPSNPDCNGFGRLGNPGPHVPDYGIREVAYRAIEIHHAPPTLARVLGIVCRDVSPESTRPRGGGQGQSDAVARDRLAPRPRERRVPVLVGL